MPTRRSGSVTLTRQANGSWMLQPRVEGVVRTLRLPAMPKREADTIRERIRELLVSRQTGIRWDAELSHWVAKLGSVLAGKLADFGLLPPRADVRLGDLLNDYIAGREA